MLSQAFKLAVISALALPVLALPGAAPAAQICVPPPGLNGHWRGNDQGDYYIREIGNTVYWVGLDSTTNGAGWTHMFTGYRSGATIKGRWADVRGNTGVGTLTLTWQGLRLVRTANTGSGFGGSRWVKRC